MWTTAAAATTTKRCLCRWLWFALLASLLFPFLWWYNAFDTIIFRLYGDMVNNETKNSMKTETFRFSYDFYNYTSNLMILHFEKHSHTSTKQKRSKNQSIDGKPNVASNVFLFSFSFCCLLFCFRVFVSMFLICMVNGVLALCCYSRVALILLLKKIMVLPNRISMFKWIYSVQIDTEHREMVV